jgi:hypothetical protein
MAGQGARALLRERKDKDRDEPHDKPMNMLAFNPVTFVAK